MTHRINTIEICHRILCFILLGALYPMLYAQQEVLNSLQMDAGQYNANSIRSVDGLFLYENDTVSLPFIDDFSTDKFRKYTAEPGDANVTADQQILLYDLPGTTPLQDTVCFMTDTTFFITYDSVTVDSMSVTYVALPSQQITVYDEDIYPFTSTLITVWPPYNVQLTTWNGLQDTLYEPIPDLCQDSVTVYLVSNIETYSRWMDNFAYRNNRYAVDPPSVGVATLDPLDEKGMPYEFNALGTYGEADLLTSKPIYMSAALDSVYLTFQYQAQGLGNQPEGEDSLVLEFWAPDSNEWYHIWSTPGKAVHNFEIVHLKVNQSQYLKDGFQFRFRNYATLSGALDHWHIDYVYLNHLRTYDDTVMKDLAFRYDTDGLLQHFTAMPWKHFKWNPASYMKTGISIEAYNGSNDPKLFGPGRMQVLFNNTVTHDFPFIITTPNAAPFSEIQMDYAVSDAPNSFVFDVLADDTAAVFEVKHALSTSTLPELITDNDTVRYQQVFSNYYAYDDGSAEAAYGPYGAGARLAYKFELAQPDTLRSLLIHFAPSVQDASLRTFWPTVWADNGGVPGAIIHQSDNLPYKKPVYLNEPNAFGEYFFDERVPLNAGTYYVGWQQQDEDVLNIGFDRNLNNAGKIFYNVATLWQNTSFQGSLMMRPVFVSETDNLTEVPQTAQEQTYISLYPNPVQQFLNVVIQNNQNSLVQYSLTDIGGREYQSDKLDFTGGTIDAGALASGIYFLRISVGDTCDVLRFVKQ